MHWIGPLRSAEFAGDLRLNTEDRPWVQLLGPLQHGGDRRNPRFVGRHLEVWLEAQRRQARGEHPLAPEQERGLTAAAHFGEALLCLAAGDAAGMRAARAGLQQVLPPELHQLLLP